VAHTIGPEHLPKEILEPPLSLRPRANEAPSDKMLALLHPDGTDKTFDECKGEIAEAAISRANGNQVKAAAKLQITRVSLYKWRRIHRKPALS
jgi:DNA-binding NtrC family response regulator